MTIFLAGAALLIPSRTPSLGIVWPTFSTVKITSCFGLLREHSIGTSRGFCYETFNALAWTNKGSSVMVESLWAFRQRRCEVHDWTIWDMISLSTSVNSRVAANCCRREWYTFVVSSGFCLTCRNVKNIKFHTLLRFKVRVQLRFGFCKILTGVHYSKRALCPFLSLIAAAKKRFLSSLIHLRHRWTIAPSSCMLNGSKIGNA